MTLPTPKERAGSVRALPGPLRLALASVLSWLVVTAAFFPMYAHMGPKAGIMVNLVVALLAWLGGLRFGLIQGLLGFGLITTLETLVSPGRQLDENAASLLLIFVMIMAISAVIGYLRDVRRLLLRQQRALIRQQHELQHQAHHDHLTGLANRRSFEERVAHEFARTQRYGQPMSVVLLDIDFFKRINDLHSHAVGDRVLQEVATLLKSGLREVDLVARYGGEEFALCLPSTPVDGALTLCERLRERIEHHDWSAIRPGLEVTISGGIYSDPLLDNAERMLARADQRLYDAKHLGRNRIRAQDQAALN